jgi:T-complex protein 1 subunit zeta
LQIGACHYLLTETRKKAVGRAKLGVEAFAEALLGVPKILAENAGYDPQEAVIAVQVRKACFFVVVGLGSRV